jgi:hypothetical protein
MHPPIECGVARRAPEEVCLIDSVARRAPEEVCLIDSERHQRSANGHQRSVQSSPGPVVSRPGMHGTERPPEVCPIFSRSSRLPSRHARNKLRYPAVTLPSPVVHFDSSTRSEPGGRFVGCTGALRSAGLETLGGLANLPIRTHKTQPPRTPAPRPFDPRTPPA